jgi:hypothetical protein
MSNVGFHLSEIGPLSICVTGFTERPDLDYVKAIIEEHAKVAHIRLTRTKDTNTFKNFYVYVDFQPDSWRPDLLQPLEKEIKALAKDDENLLLIHRYSQVDQIFFGSLHPIITEQVLMKNVDFGQLIHIEVKYRSNQSTNYGFATVLDSKQAIEKLIEKRSYVVNGVRIEFKPKLNKLNKKNNIQQNAPAIKNLRATPFVPSSTRSIANQFIARDNVAATQAEPATGAPRHYGNMNFDHFDSYTDFKYERELYMKYLAERAYRRKMYESVFARERYF